MYQDLTTDELINKVIEIGVPIPKYDYSLNEYTIEVPQNLKVGNAVRGYLNITTHQTFREACIEIINILN